MTGPCRTSRSAGPGRVQRRRSAQLGPLPQPACALAVPTEASTRESSVRSSPPPARGCAGCRHSPPPARTTSMGSSRRASASCSVTSGIIGHEEGPAIRRAFEAKAAVAPAGLLGPVYRRQVPFLGTSTAGVSTAVRCPFCFPRAPLPPAAHQIFVHPTKGPFWPQSGTTPTPY